MRRVAEYKPADLPRLAYVSDVPVEASYHGSALVHRLLGSYPKEKLLIVEGSLYKSLRERRIQGVRYEQLAGGCERLLRTRFRGVYSTFLAMSAKWRTSELANLLVGFQPQAVVSVTHGYLWITAAQLSAKYKLPLHIICHDDWLRLGSIVEPFKERFEILFGKIYRQAASHLCVSPFMEAEYARRFGVSGTVLYPSRAVDCLTYGAPPLRLRHGVRSLTVAFGGTINSSSVTESLVLLAGALEKISGRLLIFGPITPEGAARCGLNASNVELRGLLPSSELMQRFRDEADVLFVPMSFDARDRMNVEISFPSKLTDYTAVGVPLLVQGPSYCSAVRWANDREGVAEVVTEQDESVLTAALGRLGNGEYRLKLGTRALDAGKRDFDYQKAETTFFRSLGVHALG